MFLLAILWYTTSIFAQQAVFIKPVVDLFFDQLSLYDATALVHDLYNKVPLASYNSRYGCMRATQALFNEVVTIEKRVHNEICFDSARLFFDAPDRTGYRYFWTDAHHLLTFDQLHQKNIDTTIFPDPISIDKPASLYNKNVVTLTLPWYDNVTKKKYSVGTRFVRIPEKDSLTHLAIKIFDPVTFSIKESAIPQLRCFIETAMSNKARQRSYVSLLKEWVSKPRRIVPYVWGGASILDCVMNDNFSTESGMLFGEKIAYFVRPDMKMPYSGIDCSGLIARAAQIVGIPYFFKNTLTLAHHLQPLKRGEKLEEGDLIWYPGHVIVVSSLAKNEIIESAGYPSGYGKLHALPVERKFAGIKTYQDLLATYFAKKPLKILHRDGHVMRTVNHFVIYKFSSIWGR